MDPDLTSWRGVPPPTATVLEGAWARLELLDPVRHAAALFRAVAHDPGLFRFLSDEPPADEGAMADWARRAAGTSDPLFFAVVDRATGEAGGRQALMRIEPRHGVAELGAILWGRGVAGTRLAGEALFLTAAWLFDRLGYRRLEWKCDTRNSRSRRAAGRFGFTFEGTFRRHMVVKGESRDTAWFAMTDADWRHVRPAFERWLDPINFDAQGRQRERLAAPLTGTAS